WNRLSVGLVYCFALTQPGVIFIYNGARTFLRTGSTGDTLIHVDIARVLADFYFKTPWLARDAFNLRIGVQVDVNMPADLDQLGGDNSHRAFVGGKGFVKLR